MKLILSLVVISALGLGALLLTSCKSKKKMHEPVTTEERPVQPFTSIEVDGVFPVEISQNGGDGLVKVEATQTMQNRIMVNSNNGKLVITMEEGTDITDHNKPKVYINIKKINSLNFRSVGSLVTTGQLKLDSLYINSESVGKLNLDIEADFIRTNLNSVGATVLKGKVREARINNKSVGTLSAYELKAGTLMIHNPAIGSAEVYADSAFYIRSSAVGTLYYKGPGVVKEMDATGLGKVKKVE